MTNEVNRRPIQTRNSWWAKRFTTVLVKIGLSPNQISLLSVLFAIAGGWLLYMVNQLPYQLQVVDFVGAAVCIQLRLLCNMFDGMVAIESGKQSKLGAVFNEVPDRVADTLFLVSAGYACFHGSLGIELGWAAALLAIYTAYIRLFGASLGFDQDFCGPMAKQHRMFILTIACVLAAAESSLHLAPWAMFVGMILIVIGLIATCVRRTWRLGKLLESK